MPTILCSGSDGPLEESRDGLGEIRSRYPTFDVVSNPHQLVYPDEGDGFQVILQLLEQYEEHSVTYIAIGPLTNLARLMERDSKLLSTKVESVFCMGGALDVPGNTSSVAEYPYAARNLLGPEPPYEFPLPLDRFFLLPLDITTNHQLPFPIYKERVDPRFESATSSARPITEFTSAFLAHTRKTMNQFGSDAMELHDIVAVWCAIHFHSFSNETSIKETRVPGWSAVQRVFDIERTGELTRGMLVVDRREDISAYASGANRAKVQAELDQMHRSDKSNLKSVVVPAHVPPQHDPWTKSVGDKSRSIWCISETPGTEALLKLLLERVWGVSID
ncbi:hypothetical protein D9757_005692 [Collybiopsis confluens]|uniref:Inosine/uridine-preferring nucleoside hydrolase domain-containing protein n=1 Tax=Collybiopsis confluens TaxID=2823264 RepID=A0A8H5FPB1_9AGAR|nr:hypothetical protein D9757_014999 [Collybiopsis confluens]KAF5388811.1 hypothetical protein D9757_005692 [Collybiopsis confluens]